jgi:glycosyltransferase involved in cell wall biosynthesis
MLRAVTSQQTVRAQPVVGIGVHRYHPAIGGSEVHARCLAEGLAARGYDVRVIAPGHDDVSAVTACDVAITYSVSEHNLALARQLVDAGRHVAWLHHPCAVVGPESLELVRRCDGILAMNPKDVALASAAGRAPAEVHRVVPASHPSKAGRAEDRAFRDRYGVEGDYILWLGAWLPAKGPLNLSRRFATLRRHAPDLPVRLVMFGGYGHDMPECERPAPHPDLLCVDRDSDHVPSALAGCAFVAFNSPGHPVGYDANPLVLIEAMMNGKTFVAQHGTPLLGDIGHLGRVVKTDHEWVRAAQRLLMDTGYRAWLERRCASAARRTFNLSTMVDGVESAIQSVLRVRRDRVAARRRYCGAFEAPAVSQALRSGSGSIG